MKPADYVKGLAIGTAAFTSKMIAENIAQRTIGKKLSVLTIPAFIISISLMGGYFVSQRMDPHRGDDLFTYAVLNPKQAAVQTGSIIASHLLPHAEPYQETPIGSGGLHRAIVGSDYYKGGRLLGYHILRNPWHF